MTDLDDLLSTDTQDNLGLFSEAMGWGQGCRSRLAHVVQWGSKVAMR